MTLEELQKEAGSRDCVVVKRGEWEAAERMLPKDPDSETPGKEWMIFVEDSWNEMGLCAHSIRSAVENLVAICQDMDNGEVIEMKIMRDDKTPEEIKALPDI